MMKILLTGQAGLDVGHLRDQPRRAPPLRREALGGGGPEPGGREPAHAVRPAPRAAPVPRSPGPRRRASCAGFTASARELSSCAEAEDALGVAAEAARRVASARLAAAVAVPDAGLPVWDRAGAAASRPTRAAQLEARLAEARAPPARSRLELPDGGAGRPARPRRAARLGVILLTDAPEPSRRTRWSFLSLLSGQAAATLHALAPGAASGSSGERLSTVGRMISTIVHDFRNPMTADRGIREHVRAGGAAARHAEGVRAPGGRARRTA